MSIGIYVGFSNILDFNVSSTQGFPQTQCPLHPRWSPSWVQYRSFSRLVSNRFPDINLLILCFRLEQAIKLATKFLDEWGESVVHKMGEVDNERDHVKVFIPFNSNMTRANQ